MSRRMWVLTAAALVPVVAVGCASMRKMKPEEAIEARQKLMKEQAKPGSRSRRRPRPATSLRWCRRRKSSCKPPRRFRGCSPRARSIQEIRGEAGDLGKVVGLRVGGEEPPDAVRELRDTAKTGNAAATQQVVQTFGRQACGTCHTPFRVPPKQS